MNKNSQQAIVLFDFKDRLKLYWCLLSLKFRQKIFSPSENILDAYNTYVRLIGLGISFVKIENNLIKASLFINAKPVSVFLRKDSSDIQVLESVIVKEEYKIALQQLKTENDWQEKIIIDAGGNIGLTTIYFHSFYPNANFFIIEPDEKNFELLKMNLKENKIVSAMSYKNALWNSNEKLITGNSFRDGKEWSITVEKNKSNTVKLNDDNCVRGITLQEIISTKNLNRIDLLKMDIEGAERFLFIDTSFLQLVSNCVSNLAIEIHDEFNCREKITEQMKLLGFSQKDDRDTTLYSKSFLCP